MGREAQSNAFFRTPEAADVVRRRIAVLILIVKRQRGIAEGKMDLRSKCQLQRVQDRAGIGFGAQASRQSQEFRSRRDYVWFHCIAEVGDNVAVGEPRPSRAEKSGGTHPEQPFEAVHLSRFGTIAAPL
jgi:hypothetical protein